MPRVRSYKIDNASYYERKGDTYSIISFTIYDTDDNMHMYSGTFEFYENACETGGCVDISFDDLDSGIEMIHMDINYYSNYEEDDDIADFIFNNSGIKLSQYK